MKIKEIVKLCPSDQRINIECTNKKVFGCNALLRELKEIKDSGQLGEEFINKLGECDVTYISTKKNVLILHCVVNDI